MTKIVFELHFFGLFPLSRYFIAILEILNLSVNSLLPFSERLVFFTPYGEVAHTIYHLLFALHIYILFYFILQVLSLCNHPAILDRDETHGLFRYANNHKKV